MIFAWAQAKIDKSAGIGNGLALPAVIRLKLAHGFFAGLIPAPGRLIRTQIVLTNQRLLNFLCAIRVNLLLATRTG